MCLQEEEGQEARLSARTALRLSKESLGGKEKISEGNVSSFYPASLDAERES